MGVGGKSGGKVDISEYTMSLHAGVCMYSPGLQLLALKYGEKEIWRGEATEETVLAINQPDLFGGSRKEGGVKGLAWWLPGGPTQVMPETLAAKRDLTSATSPGYRGFASVYFTGIRGVAEGAWQTLINTLRGEPSNNRSGFYWGANNPYLRSLSMRLRRPSLGLDPQYALIRLPDDTQGREQYGSNPSHMIYECLTNTDWGLGENPAVIDKPVFEAAAQTLFAEGFGLNILWARQTEVEAFIGEILTHIRAACFVHPATGKHTLKLLRADYDPEAAPFISPSNAKLGSFRRKVWGDISNEVVVTITNHETGKEETIAAQDLAGIAAQGGIVSSAQNYYGITSQALGTFVAERDLATFVNPIATCEAEVSREFWDAVANDVVRLSWPAYEIEQIVFRVSEVTRNENTVNLVLYEDIFGLDLASYLGTGNSQWVNPSQPPSPVTYYQVGTAPAFVMASALGLSDASELDYPEALSAVTVGADSDDDVDYEIVSYVTDVNGTTTRQSLGSRSYRGTWVLLSGLPAEAQSSLPVLSGLRGPAPNPGDFVLIGTGADAFTEIATVQSADETGYVLNRGILDTVPREWPVGTRAFVIPVSVAQTDPTVRAVGEDTSYWLLPRTTVGRLTLAAAPQINVTLSPRPYQPNRPGNVKVNGVGFGTYVAPSGATSFSVTWANRSRLLESTQVSKWTDAGVAGEPGQTTKVSVRQPDGTPILEYVGLTGESQLIPFSALGAHKDVRIKVTAIRDSFESLQGHMIRATRP